MPLFACIRKDCACGQSIMFVLMVFWAVGALAQPRFSGERMAQGTSGRLVRVAAASDLKFALDEISTAFRTKHPDITIQVSYGSSGNFFAPISKRGQFDIFFSAVVGFSPPLIKQ